MNVGAMRRQQPAPHMQIDKRNIQDTNEKGTKFNALCTVHIEESLVTISKTYHFKKTDC
jgi:hypothetical protein